MINLNQKLKSRNIRVFLSSTFTDMQAERTRLVKETFLRLKLLARERGVELTEVDLRWGLTKEDAQSGKVIRLCLNEIRECERAGEDVPFFVGLLGHRYGWRPTMAEIEKDPRTAADFPLVKDQVGEGLSVTEMEIQHGMLQDPSMRERRTQPRSHVSHRRVAQRIV